MCVCVCVGGGGGGGGEWVGMWMVVGTWMRLADKKYFFQYFVLSCIQSTPVIDTSAELIVYQLLDHTGILEVGGTIYLPLPLALLLRLLHALERCVCGL